MELHRHVMRQIRFNGWANDRILAKAVTVLPEKPAFGESYGVLADEVLHVLQAQQHWLAVWRGVPSHQTDNPTTAELVKAFAASQAALEEWMGGLDDPALAKPFTRTGRSESITAPLGDLIAHLVTHQNFHRGEIALLLTNAGASTGDIDYYDFILEDGG